MSTSSQVTWCSSIEIQHILYPLLGRPILSFIGGKVKCTIFNFIIMLLCACFIFSKYLRSGLFLTHLLLWKSSKSVSIHFQAYPESCPYQYPVLIHLYVNQKEHWKICHNTGFDETLFMFFLSLLLYFSEILILLWKCCPWFAYIL